MKKRITITIVGATLAAVAIFLGATQAARLTRQIKNLESDIARLESKIELSETKKDTDAKPLHLLQVPKPPQVPNTVTILPAPMQPAQNPPTAEIPPGWQRREFNGMTYYLVPLANEPGQSIQLGALK